MSRATRLLVVLGYSSGRSHELHPICRARLDRAVHRGRDARAIVLSGWARRGGAISEAEQMRRAWPGAHAEVISDPGSRRTAETAAYVAVLARRLRATEVELVTSWWHAPRAALLFRFALRGQGARVRVMRARGSSPPRLLLRELLACALVPLDVAALAVRAGQLP